MPKREGSVRETAPHRGREDTVTKNRTKPELWAQVKYLAQRLADYEKHPDFCQDRNHCPDGGCAECWRTAADEATAGAGLPQSRRRGNPNGSAAFGDRRGIGAAEGRTKKADEFAGKLAGIVAPMKAEGLSFRAIADRLNEQGKLTPHGCRWQANSVKRLLERLDVGGAKAS